MRGRMKGVAVAFAWALCATAHADERAAAWPQGRALADERLGELRAGVAAPAAQYAGVILWDEPRKAPPPPRQAEPGHGSCAVLAASVMRQ